MVHSFLIDLEISPDIPIVVKPQKIIENRKTLRKQTAIGKNEMKVDIKMESTGGTEFKTNASPHLKKAQCGETFVRIINYQ